MVVTESREQVQNSKLHSSPLRKCLHHHTQWDDDDYYDDDDDHHDRDDDHDSCYY